MAAAAASAGLHGADLRRGPVPALAREYATVAAEVEITSDPRLTRPRVRGDHLTPDSVLINGEVRSVEEVLPSGAGAVRATVATRAPVLVLVDVGSRWGAGGQPAALGAREPSGGGGGREPSAVGRAASGGSGVSDGGG
ncbi:MBL fold metallo-hydrolase, partial [Streptomyces sp. ME18-1-4]|nr:MBL fold metallo-hydrolase [Streptomyces sp. ME18-1-4]